MENQTYEEEKQEEKVEEEQQEWKKKEDQILNRKRELNKRIKAIDCPKRMSLYVA